jgi:hypothetical protein
MRRSTILRCLFAGGFLHAGIGAGPASVIAASPTVAQTTCVASPYKCSWTLHVREETTQEWGTSQGEGEEVLVPGDGPLADQQTFANSSLTWTWHVNVNKEDFTWVGDSLQTPAHQVALGPDPCNGEHAGTTQFAPPVRLVLPQIQGALTPLLASMEIDLAVSAYQLDCQSRALTAGPLIGVWRPLSSDESILGPVLIHAVDGEQKTFTFEGVSRIGEGESDETTVWTVTLREGIASSPQIPNEAVDAPFLVLEPHHASSKYGVRLSYSGHTIEIYDVESGTTVCTHTREGNGTWDAFFSNQEPPGNVALVDRGLNPLGARADNIGSTILTLPGCNEVAPEVADDVVGLWESPDGQVQKIVPEA